MAKASKLMCGEEIHAKKRGRKKIKRNRGRDGERERGREGKKGRMD